MMTEIAKPSEPNSRINPAQGALPVNGKSWQSTGRPEIETARRSCGSEDEQRILEAAISILRQGEDLLQILAAETYVRKNPVVFNASIGGHYRHCLDHFTSLLRVPGQDEVDYDHRDRDVRIETQPEFALDLTREMRRTLEELAPAALSTPVMARCEVSYEHGGSPLTRSTYGRELVYSIAHAIHHFALISVMGRLMEVKLPDHFGVAPSTVAYQASAKLETRQNA